MLIDVEQLAFRWPRAARDCLAIETLHIAAGERVFLFGASGSGKSTLLGLLGGVLQPQRGRIAVLDSELTALSAHRRDRFRVDHVGFVFQQFNLVPYLGMVDNVLLPCRFSARRAQRAETSDGTPARAAQRLLAAMGLPESMHGRPVTQLSVGQQQRVAAARALIGRPELVIADEPTSSLDADAQSAFLDLLLREVEAAQSTLLFVSHDRRLATHFHRSVDLAVLNTAPRELETAE